MNNIRIKVESGGVYGGNLARISINDIEIGYANYSRGINVAAIDPERGQPLIATTFDTLAAESSEVLIQFIEQLPAGVIVALAVKEDANYSFSEAAKKACEALGSIKVHQLPTVGSWAMIGKKGDAPGSATEEVSYGPAIQTHTLSVGEAAPSLGVICVTSSGGDRAYRTQITLNGAPVSVEGGCQRGLNVAVFDETQGTLLVGGTFDLLADPSSADAFAQLIESLPDGRIVAIAACDDASFNLSEAAKKACEAIGSRLIRQLAFRGEWAIVGRKGAAGGVTVENLSNHGVYWGGEPVTVTFWIPPAVPAAPAEERLAPPAVPAEEMLAPPAVPAEESPIAGAPKQIALAHKLQPADLKGNSKFSHSVAISGDWAIAGASWASARSKDCAGAAYIFQHSNGAWEQKQKLQPAKLQGGDWFGSSVAISGDWAIVGASCAGAPGSKRAGAAYIFQYESGSWQQKQKLQPADLQRNDFFGSTVAISDGWAIVGASDADAPGKENVGAAYIFQCENGVWEEKQKLQPAQLQRGDCFGSAVAISGGWAIVGAIYTDAAGFDSAGAAYLFQCESGVWQQKHKLKAAELQTDEEFGISVAISGDWAIVGASGAGVPGQEKAGAAYVFQCESGVWQQKHKLQPADLQGGERFGHSVSVCDGWAIVGVGRAGAAGKQNAGAAYIFQCENGVWQQKRKLQPEELQPDDRFGCAVAISGSRAMVGAGYARTSGKSRAGAAYVFEGEVLSGESGS
ncbi:MAG: hypothetical protein KME26_11890 [Oscillatoria princeps RMCB-10]|nr:hypothetical protein [Oscillatoria princeps RMCB-10]